MGNACSKDESGPEPNTQLLANRQKNEPYDTSLLSNELQEKEQRIKDLKKKLKEEQQKSINLVEQNNALQTKIDTTQRQLNASYGTDETLKLLQSQKETLDQQLTEVKQDYQNSQTRINNLKTQLDESKARLEKERQEMEQSIKTKEELHKQNTQNLKSEYEKQAQYYKEQIAKNETEIQSIKNKLQAAEQERNDLLVKSSGNAEESSAIQNQLKKYEQQVTEKDETIDELRKSVSTLQTEASEKNMQCSQLSNDVEQYKNELQEKNNQIEKMSADIKKLEEENKKQYDLLGKEQNENQKWQDEVTQSKNTISGLEADIASIKEDSKNKDNQIKSLEEKIESLKNSKPEDQTEKPGIDEAKYGELQELLEDKVMEIIQFKEENEKLKMEIEGLKNNAETTSNVYVAETQEAAVEEDTKADVDEPKEETKEPEPVEDPEPVKDHEPVEESKPVDDNLPLSDTIIFSMLDTLLSSNQEERIKLDETWKANNVQSMLKKREQEFIGFITKPSYELDVYYLDKAIKEKNQDAAIEILLTRTNDQISELFKQYTNLNNKSIVDDIVNTFGGAKKHHLKALLEQIKEAKRLESGEHELQMLWIKNDAKLLQTCLSSSDMDDKAIQEFYDKFANRSWAHINRMIFLFGEITGTTLVSEIDKKIGEQNSIHKWLMAIINIARCMSNYLASNIVKALQKPTSKATDGLIRVIVSRMDCDIDSVVTEFDDNYAEGLSLGRQIKKKAKGLTFLEYSLLKICGIDENYYDVGNEDTVLAFSARRRINPSIVGCDDFNVTTDVTLLSKILSNKSSTSKQIKQEVIDVLALRSIEQRAKISEEYKKKFHVTLITDMKKYTKGATVEVVERFIEYSEYADANDIHTDASNGDLVNIGNIICTKTSDELLKICKAYKRLYNVSLEDKLPELATKKGKQSVAIIFDYIIRRKRNQSKVVDIGKVAKDVNWLMETEKYKGDDKEKLVKLFAENSQYYLLQLIEQFEKKSGKNLTTYVEKSLGTNSSAIIMVLIEYARNSNRFFSKMIKELAEKWKKNEIMVSRIFISRAEIDLNDIRITFEEEGFSEGKTFAAWIDDKSKQSKIGYFCQKILENVYHQVIKKKKKIKRNAKKESTAKETEEKEKESYLNGGDAGNDGNISVSRDRTTALSLSVGVSAESDTKEETKKGDCSTTQRQIDIITSEKSRNACLNKWNGKYLDDFKKLISRQGAYDKIFDQACKRILKGDHFNVVQFRNLFIVLATIIVKKNAKQNNLNIDQKTMKKDAATIEHIAIWIVRKYGTQGEDEEIELEVNGEKVKQNMKKVTWSKTVDEVTEASGKWLDAYVENEGKL